LRDPQEAVRRFGAVYAALEVELDWQLLGREYCEGDGSDFFDAALRERVLDTGLRFADELSLRLAADGARRSLYLGAAVAELAPILAEQLVLGREVIWLNLDNVETRELARAIEAVSARMAIPLPRPASASVEDVAHASCDHLWMVSVLSDPDQFPALHDELYARTGDALATGRGVLEDDRRRAELLVRSLLDKAMPQCVLSASDEELEFLQGIAQRLGWRIEVPASFRLSAIVGDRVRHCALTRQ
jgi:hypothetical protein